MVTYENPKNSPHSQDKFNLKKKKPQDLDKVWVLEYPGPDRLIEAGKVAQGHQSFEILQTLTLNI